MAGLPFEPRVLHLVARMGAVHPRPHSPELQGLCGGHAPFVCTFAGLVRLLDTADLQQVPSAAPRVKWDAWHSRLQMAQVLQHAGLAEADAQASGAWRAVRSLREAGVDVATLQRAAASLPLESVSAAAQVAGLLRAYEARLSTARARDEASAWQRAMAVARQATWPAPLWAIQHVWLDCDVEAVGARLALLLAMARSGRRVSVALAFDSEQPMQNPWAEAILGSLEASGEANLEAVLVPPRPAALASSMQRSYAPAALPVEVLQCSAGDALVAHVVHQVHAWVQAGTPPDRIAIALPNRRPPLWARATHQARLLRALAAAGLPVEGAEPEKFAEHPVGKLLQQLLTLVAAQAEAQPASQQASAALAKGLGPAGPSLPVSLAESLTGSFVGSLPASLPVSALGALMAHFGAPVGLPAVAGPQGVGTAAAQLAPQRAATWLWRVGHRRLPWDALTQALASMDDVGPASARALTANLRRLVADVCGRMGAAQTLAQACLALVHLLDVFASLPAVQAAAPRAAGAQATAGQQTPALSAEEHACLRTALVALAVADKACGEPRRDVASWQRWVLQLLHETPLPMPPSNGGVAIRTPEACAGSTYAKVLLVGANPGVFPAPARPNPWLPEPLLRALVAIGGPRITPTASVAADAPLPFDARERAQWQQLVAAATDALQVVVLSAPDSAENGPSAAVSSLLADPQVSASSELPLAVPTHLQPLSTQASLEALLRAVAVQRPVPTLQASAALEGACAARAASLWRRVAWLARPHAAAHLSADIAHRQAEAWLAREHRATALDQLGACRFRYFAEFQLQLQPQMPPSFAASARQRGTAMHAGLEVSLRALLEAPGGFVGQCADPAAAMALAQQAFDTHIDHILPKASVHPMLFAALRQQVWSAVSLRLELDLRNPHAVPRVLEHRFGESQPQVGPLLVVEPAVDGHSGAANSRRRAARIRGSIDRVDVHVAGNEAGAEAQATLCTYDYKSSLPSRQPHRHLQLGLYSLVVAREFPRLASAHEAAWIALTGSKAGDKKVAKELAGDATHLAETVGRDLWQRLGPLLDGAIAPDPEAPAICRSCSYADLCHLRIGSDEDDDGGDSAAEDF